MNKKKKNMLSKGICKNNHCMNCNLFKKKNKIQVCQLVNSSKDIDIQENDNKDILLFNELYSCDAKLNELTLNNDI